MPAIHLAVIGAGTMGRGIAETAACRGLSVIVVEVSDTQRDAAEAQIRRSVGKAIERRKIDAGTLDEVLARITWSADLAAAAQAPFVVEAVPEVESIKSDVLKRLDACCPKETLLATNTSSISISRLARATERPEKVVGMHFFNPVPVMPPVEIVRGDLTSEETIAATRELAQRLGKQPLVVRDRPGFVVNRVLMPLINEAIWALDEKVADAYTIDSLMKLGCNHPMGPLELADFIGLDICLAILRVLHKELGDEKFRPCPLLEQMVGAGQLGRKSGRGFFEYGSR
jgi:3-hydroxybutyryl-CoA dehydrogenase